MNFYEKLLNVISSCKAKYFTAKMVYSMLGTKSSFERDAVNQALNQLVKDGKLVFDNRNRRYSLVDNGEFFRAVVDGNARGFGFLLVEDGDLFVPANKMNGAYHKDTVLYRRVEGTADEAEVVTVLERGMTQIVGTFQVNGNARFVIPDERKFSSDIHIAFGKDLFAKNGQKVVAKVISYPVDNRNSPEGEIIQVLGYAGERNVDVMSVAYSFGLSKDFPPNVMKYADKVATDIANEDLSYRKDLRNVTTFTIDGADAKDLDDAVSVQRNDNGTYTLGVHIADVSHYVPIGGDIDKEAFRRGTSVYLPDVVFPMLPTTLSNGICSLYEGVDRLTFTCSMVIDAKGKVTEYDVYPSVIRSKHRMTYDDVQAILDGDKQLCSKYSDIVPDLVTMQQLANVLIAKRNKRGNIDFATKEVHFVTDEQGKVVDIVPYERLFSHRIIEEFMIIANETVAEYARDCELPFVYRVHDKPDEEKLQTLLQLMRGVGIIIKPVQEVRSSLLSNALEQARTTPYFNLVNDVMLRTMQKAKYSQVNVGHFGLASGCYCHFTSPIRRYADLTVHRVLKTAYLGKLTDKAYTAYEDIVSSSATQCSERERIADEAERKADDVKRCLYARNIVGNTYDAIISGITDNGIFAELPNTVEGFIEIDELGDDLTYNKDKFVLFNDAVRYSLGDKISITVADVNVSACKIYFHLNKNVD